MNIFNQRDKKQSTKFLMLCLVIISFVSCNKPEKKDPITNAENQLSLLLKNTDKKFNGQFNPETDSNSSYLPRSINKNKKIKLVNTSDWCSGFFPGCLWEIYELTGDKKWEKSALRFTLPIENQKFNGGTHDMGFKMTPSFGKAYKFTGDTTYRNILIQAAKTLCTRFNPTVGCIKSWDFNEDKWQFPVIIDNMMNLELLFWATQQTGDSVYYNIAVSHAKTTMKNHFRKDYSCYHVVDYNPETGAVNQKITHQGYADESSWARGQGWALYGFTMVYRETHNKIFLEQAKNVASYILTFPGMPEDLIPYWDYMAPDIPNAPRDASAAAVTASALYELSSYVQDPDKAFYLQKANKIMNSLSTKYTSKPGTNYGFILDHSTGHKPGNSEIDVPIIYSDYYYLEALIRKTNITKSNNVK